MEHDGCVGCKYEMCEPDSIECSGCTQNAEDKYTRKTNREVMLELLSNDNYRLAKALIETSPFDDGYEDSLGNWISLHMIEYTSPNGKLYNEYKYNECLKETVEWLERKVD